MEFGIVLFYSTNAALRLEKSLRSQGLKCKLIPTPRQMSTDCGTALRFQWIDAETVNASIETTSIEVAQVARI